MWTCQTLIHNTKPCTGKRQTSHTETHQENTQQGEKSVHNSPRREGPRGKSWPHVKTFQAWGWCNLSCRLWKAVKRNGAGQPVCFHLFCLYTEGPAAQPHPCLTIKGFCLQSQQEPHKQDPSLLYFYWIWKTERLIQVSLIHNYCNERAQPLQCPSSRQWAGTHNYKCMIWLHLNKSR